MWGMLPPVSQRELQVRGSFLQDTGVSHLKLVEYRCKQIVIGHVPNSFQHAHRGAVNAVISSNVALLWPCWAETFGQDRVQVAYRHAKDPPSRNRSALDQRLARIGGTGDEMIRQKPFHSGREFHLDQIGDYPSKRRVGR